MGNADWGSDAGSAGSAAGSQSVEMVFERFGEFLEQFSGSLSVAGMFLPTDQSRSVGTTVQFVFRLSDGYKLLSGVGEVLWTRESFGPLKRRGLGILFCAMDGDSQNLVTKVVETHSREGGELFDIYNPPDPDPILDETFEPLPLPDFHEQADLEVASEDPTSANLTELQGSDSVWDGSKTPLGESTDPAAGADAGDSTAFQMLSGSAALGGAARVGSELGQPAASSGEEMLEAVSDNLFVEGDAFEVSTESDEGWADLDTDLGLDTSTDLDEAPALEIEVPMVEPVVASDSFSVENPLDADPPVPSFELPPLEMNEPTGLGMSSEFDDLEEPIALGAEKLGTRDEESVDAFGHAPIDVTLPLDSDVPIGANESAPTELPATDSFLSDEVAELPEDDLLEALPSLEADEVSTPALGEVEDLLEVEAEPAEFDVPPLPPMEAMLDAPDGPDSSTPAPAPAVAVDPVEMPVAEEIEADDVPPYVGGRSASSASGTSRWTLYALPLILLGAIAFFAKDHIAAMLSGAKDKPSTTTAETVAPSVETSSSNGSGDDAESSDLLVQAKDKLVASGVSDELADEAAAALDKVSEDLPDGAKDLVAELIPDSAKGGKNGAGGPKTRARDGKKEGAAEPLPVNSERPTIVKKIQWNASGRATNIVIKSDGGFMPGTYEVVRVASGQPRELLKIYGIGSAYSPTKTDVGNDQVTAVRTGFHTNTSAGSELHVVLDLASADVAVTRVEASGKSLTLRVE